MKRYLLKTNWDPFGPLKVAFIPKVDSKSELEKIVKEFKRNEIDFGEIEGGNKSYDEDYYTDNCRNLHLRVDNDMLQEYLDSTNRRKFKGSFIMLCYGEIMKGIEEDILIKVEEIFKKIYPGIEEVVIRD